MVVLVTLPPMLRPRALALIAMSLAVIAVLAVTVPAGAHTATPVAAEVLRTSAPDLPAGAVSLPAAPVRHRGAPTVPRAAVPGTPVGPSSLLLSAIVLGALGIGFSVEAARRHPRRALVLVLGLLLAIFAFENGLHSVHHGFDPTPYREF